jgi:DNA primase
MIEASVMRASQTGREPYGFFRDRVRFPVADMRGRIVAFSGRVLPEHIRPLKDPDKKPPKYINSTDTPLFHKGRMLYAQQHARGNAPDHPVVVVEGQMDVIACHQAGLRATVAPLGTALTEDQVSVLWKMIPHERKEPVLCFDGDNAGYRAAVRAAERVLPQLKPNHSIRFAFLPEGEDPDTFISARGLDAFSAKLSNGLSLLDFLWTHTTSGQDFSSPEMRAGLSARLDALAAKIQDGQVQFHYKQAFRDKTRQQFSSFDRQRSFQKDANGGKGKFGGKPASPSIALPPIRKDRDFIPRIVVTALINHPFLFAHFADRLHEISPEDRDIERLYVAVLDYMQAEDSETLDREGVSRHLNEVGLADLAMKLTHDRVYLHAGFCRPDASPEIALQGLKDLWINWERSRLAEDIQSARAVFRLSMTPENERRILALQQLQREQE